MNNDELIQIPYIAHETAVTRLYKIIKWLIAALVIVSVLFVSYIAVDRYLDNVSDDSLAVTQHSSDEATNFYNHGGTITNGNTEDSN